MRLLSFLTAATALSITAFSSAGVRTCVDSVSEGRPIGPRYACDAKGNPLYTAPTQSGDNPLYGRSADGSVRITISGTGFKVIGTPASGGDGSVFVQTSADGSTNQWPLLAFAAGSKQVSMDANGIGDETG